MLFVERHPGSPNQARESLRCGTGRSRLEERQERRHTQLLNSLNSPTISEDNRQE